MQRRFLQSVTWTSFAVSLILVGLLAACSHPQNPYLRDLKPDPSDPDRVTIEKAYLKALLADLDACYTDRQ